MKDMNKELTALFHGDESDVFERKESGRVDVLGPAICAFSNNPMQKRGMIFIGQKDDRACAGMSDKEAGKLLESIPNLRDSISPTPIFNVRHAQIENCNIVAVDVEPSRRPPVRYKGHAYVRIGATTRKATHEDEDRLVERKNQNLRDAAFFDQQATFIPADLGDLNWTLIENEYLPAAVSPEVLAENRRTREMRLSSLRLLTPDGKPNNAAVLCFCEEPRRYLPGAYIQFARFAGTELTDGATDHQEINGPVFHQILRLREKIRAHISAARDIGGSDRTDYPFAAVDQAICNAVMHRDYENGNAPARCYWFSDRIEIHSPGRVFGDVTPENFGNGATTDYRNPVLAEAMKTMGFVEKFGAGIATIKRAMSDNGNPSPHLEAGENYVLIKLPAKRK